MFWPNWPYQRINVVVWNTSVFACGVEYISFCFIKMRGEGNKIPF